MGVSMHRYLCTIWLINSWSRHVVPVLHSFVGGSRQGPRPRTRRCAATPTGQTPAPRASHSRRARPTSVTRTGRWRGPGGAGAGTASPPTRTSHTTYPGAHARIVGHTQQNDPCVAWARPDWSSQPVEHRARALDHPIRPRPAATADR
jgi:hypothetical protein